MADKATTDGRKKEGGGGGEEEEEEEETMEEEQQHHQPQPPAAFLLSNLQAAAADIGKGSQHNSSLYDSYELKSFQKQLDAALAGSMPCINRPPASSPSSLTSSPSSSTSTSTSTSLSSPPCRPTRRKSAFARVMRKAVKAFRRRPPSAATSEFTHEGYESSGNVLTAIPEGREEPPVFRKAASERFTCHGSVLR